MDAVVEKLVLVPLLADLTGDQLKRVARACERQFIAPGQTLIEAGEVPEAAYLCLDDAIACETETSIEGQWQRSAVPEGSTLAEFAMIVETEVSVRFLAVDHARVIRIGRDKLTAQLEADAALAAAMTETLARRLSETAARMREASLPFFVPLPSPEREYLEHPNPEKADPGKSRPEQPGVGAAGDGAPGDAADSEEVLRSA